MAFTYITLTAGGGFRDATGTTPPLARIYARPHVDMVNGVEIVDHEVVLPVNSSGTATKTLAATTDAATLPVGNYYHFRVEVAGRTVRRFMAALPHTPTTVDLSDLTELVDPDEVVAGTVGIADVTGLTSALALKAPLASPTFTGTVTLPRVASTPVTVTYGSTTTIDASLGSRFKVTATGNFTLAVPTNPVDGQQITVMILASGAERTMTVHASILLTTGLSASVAIASGKRWIGGLIYDGTLAAWILVASTQLS